MPHRSEEGLLEDLRSSIPDITPEYSLEGRGRKWLAHLYSKEHNIAIEVCSRKPNQGKTGVSNTELHEKFYSALLKLIDIKGKNPEIKPLMICENLIPALPSDLELCSKWGIYLLARPNMWIRGVLKGEAPSVVNKRAIRFLMWRDGEPRPRLRWLSKERRMAILSLLKARAMTVREICEAVSQEYNEVNRYRFARILGQLGRQGKIRKLMDGFVKGHGAVYGTDDSQLDAMEQKLFVQYKEHKRKKRLSERILQVLKEEGALSYGDIISRLAKKWGIQAERHQVVGILNKSLIGKGLVKVKEKERRLKYSIG